MKLRWYILIILACIVLGILMFLYTRPRVGSITAANSGDESTIEPQRYTSFTSDAIGLSVSYPATYTLRSQTDEMGTVTAVFVTNDGATRKLAIQRKPWNASRQEFPGIAMRLRNTDSYSQASYAVGGREMNEFTSNAGEFERVLFLQRDGSIVSIALSATTQAGSVKAEEEYRDILQSVQWLK